MAHLNFFGVENFKVFADLHRFDLKPITILTGTNSSGKSSLTKAILLLKEGFEKVKLDREKISGFDEDGFIDAGANIHETTKLNFDRSFNLGNFSNTQNNTVQKDVMIFEYPIRLPTLTDKFILVLEYSVAKNKMRQGVQSGVKIIHEKTKQVILNFHGSSNQLKIDFTFLFRKLSKAISLTNDYSRLTQRLEEIIELYFKNVGDLSLKNIEREVVNKINESNVPNNIKNEVINLWSDITILISNDSVMIGDEQIDIYSFFDLYSFKADRGYMYYLKLFTLKNLNFQTLLDYSFLYDEEFLQLYCTEKGIDYTEYMVKNSFLRRLIEQKCNGNLASYLNGLELSALDELSIYVSPELEAYGIGSDFYEVLHQLGHYSTWTKDFKKKLIEKDSIYESIFDGDLIVNAVSNTSQSNFSKFIRDFIYNGINSCFDTLGKINRSLYYIPSVRTKVDRIFRNNSDSYLHDLLFQLQQNDLTEEAKEFIDKYLLIFKIADSIDFSVAEDSSFVKVSFVKEGEKVELVDLGYGVSQVLPIILKIATLISRYAPDEFLGERCHDSSILIIEEPESNLHPALQSKLADMLVECYEKYNIQFIIETHSEYLVRKLQYLTAKKQFAAEDSVIYYFHDPNNVPKGEKQVKRIDILEDGSLSDDFGTGFFDEAANWELELLRLKNSKARQN